ncbi:STAS domain-containing protein [Parasphingorhabdus pacifica]
MAGFGPADPQPAGQPLRITIKRWEPTITLLEVAGEVDTVAAAELAERITAQCDPQRFLLVDLSEVTFLCSAGLVVLVESRERARTTGVDLRLIATPRPVQRLIAQAGLDGLPTYPTLLAALPLQR